MRTQVASIFFLLLLAASCDYRRVKEQPRVSRNTNFSIASLSYASVNAQVFSAHCLDCHGTKGGVNLETYGETVKHLGAIKNALLSKQMPPPADAANYPPLSESQIGLVVAWIEAGAPELSGGIPDPVPTPEPTPNDPLPPAETLKPTYASINKLIFGPKKCLECHVAGGRAEDYPMTTREEIIDPKIGLVNFSEPEKSSLVMSIQDGSMPPRRLNLPKIPEEDINVIIEWIRQGAPEGESP